MPHGSDSWIQDIELYARGGTRLIDENPHVGDARQLAVLGGYRDQDATKRMVKFL